MSEWKDDPVKKMTGLPMVTVFWALLILGIALIPTIIASCHK